MKTITLILLLAGGLLLLLVGGLAIAGDENRGAEILLIDAGRKHNVHFPHYQHQDVLGDCQICHDLFPKEAGSIKRLKDQGKLRKKQVMKKHCIDCHRKMKAEDKKTGPLTCGSCHYK